MRRSFLLLFFLCTSLLLFAQEPVRFGDREVYLEANVRGKVRGHKTSSLELGIPLGEKLNVLVQFGANKSSRQLLAKYGIELGDYLGSNAYYATVKPGSRPSDFVGAGIRTVVPLRWEWKLPSGLLENNPPEWAQVNGQLQMSLTWFPTVNWSTIQRILEASGITYNAPSELFRSVKVLGTPEALVKVAAEEGVAVLTWSEAPQELENNIGARLSGARVLRIPTSDYGRALTGKGVRIGVWDGNVGDHVDYGKRVHCLEFESSIASSGAHGMHVTGTIGGSGLLDPNAKGMAPEAEIWTSNFNKSSNKKNEATEMYEAFENYRISLTSNSYGAQMRSLCNYQNLLTYDLFGKPEIDYLAYVIPELTHVFAAGNNQGHCNLTYGSTTKYSKNVITVGAVDSKGKTTSFSSYGPLKDGRMYPTVAAMGDKVYSTVDMQTYDLMSGTSMACPTVTGHLALVTQRFKQLNGGAVPYNYFLKALIANTATDAGRPGPDYQYGYGIVNAVAAVEALENNWYKLDELTDGQTTDFKIQVPAGIKELRVMLSWNDPVAKKNYAVGECPLVNDLDLTVTSGSTTVFPWTLTPALPETNAVQDKKNDKDPLEQVSINAPAAGEYVVHVSGSVKQGDKQPYAIVWYFDKQIPELASPLAGETYEPGEEVFLKTANLSGALRVELSYDNGKAYKALGVYDNCTKIALPSDAPATKLAMLRVIDEAGVVLQTEAPFTIMPQVKNVKLADKACANNNWSLAWDAVATAASYEVLRVNLETEKYEVLTSVTTTSYALPTDNVKNERNIYAVRAVSSDGVKGKRSVGVLATKSRALSLAKEDLPYTEHFIGWPMDYASASRGENLNFQTSEAYASLHFPLGANMLLWQARTKEPNWTAPFDKKNNCGSVEVCQLDLTKIAAGTKLHFIVYALMLASDVPNGSMLRLLVNDHEHADVLNRTQIAGDGGEHTYTWDLSEFAEQSINLKIETALQERKNAILMVYYRLQEGDDKKDVFTYGLSKIPSKEDMEVETIRFKVKNNSALELAQVPITVSVDDKLAYTETLTAMKPFEDREIKVEYDFTSEKAHKFNVKVAADVQDDLNEHNNAKQMEVYNLGNVIRMPKTQIVKYLGLIDLPEIPYEKLRITGVQTFVDNGGHLEGYPANDEGVLQLLPSSPEKAIQVTFKNYDLGASDALAVYTGNVPDDLKNGLAKVTPTEELAGKSTKERVFLSEATNGGITFRFVSGSKHLGEGWEAEVREVQLTNRWQLFSLEEVDGSEANRKKIVATIKNFAPIAFHQVKLTTTVGAKTEIHTIPTLAANAITKFEFPEEIDVTPPVTFVIEASLPKDADVSDNVASLAIEHDPLWHSGKVKRPSALYIKQITPLGEKPINCPATQKISYEIKKKLTLYAKGKNAFELKLSYPAYQSKLPSKVRVWINFDDNAELKDAAPELYTVELVKQQDTYWLEIDLSTFTDLKLGEHRMRFMLANDENYTKYKEGQEIEWGQVFDFTAVVKDGVSPLDKDVAIVALEDLASGTNLSAASEVKLRVRNNGLTPVEKIKLQYKLNDAAPEVQEFDQQIAPHGGEAVVTFTKKADLSTIGKYVFEFLLDGEDANVENNKLKRSIYHIAPTTDQLYTIAFNGTKEEYMGLTGIEKDFNTSVTIEGWWKLDGPQLANLIIAPSIWIASVAGFPSLPDNTLYIEVGKNQLLVSTEPVIKPGQWQHIAVALTKTKNYFSDYNTIAAVYIDGVKVNMQSQGRDGFELPYLLVSRKFKGETSMLRFWNSAQVLTDLNANKYKSVRKSTGELEENCVAEFLFTEGKGNASASGTKHFVSLASKRASNELWQPMRLVNHVMVEGQVLPAQYVEKDLIEVKLASTVTDFSKIKLKFIADWEGVAISQAGTPHSDAREYDFSDATHTLEFSAKKSELFGKEVEQKVKIKLVNDLSAACDLTHLSLNKTDNPRVKNDVELTNPDQSIILNVENENETQPIDPKEIHLTFKTISASAKLFDGTTEVELNKPYKVDLSLPHTFRVCAENGRDEKFYTVTLAMAQTINWETTKLTYTFTKDPIILDAKATSQLPVSYVSENPSVVTIANDGKLYTAGVGTTFVLATQKGSAPYSAATVVKREVEVQPADLTIKVKEGTMEVGTELPQWEFEYVGLVYPNTESLFDTEYEVLDKTNQVWNPTMPPLAVGDYVVRAKDYSAPYKVDNYNVTRTDGTLHVKASATAHTLTLRVKDENNAPLEGVSLRLGELNAKSDVQGEYVLTLQAGKYTVVATKDDYTVAEEAFEIKDADLICELKLAKRSLTLKYSADTHGVILGKKEQKVAKGQDGETVTAVPLAQNYRFKRWSDDNKEALRCDRNVQDSKEVTAEFEEIMYTLTYKVSEGGEFEPGSVQTQTVAYDTDGTEVKVKAKPGYVFGGWSDGLKNPERTDKHVMKDLEVIAIFVKPYLLAWSENFDFGDEMLKDWDIDLAKQGVSWTVRPKSAVPNFPNSTGFVAMVDTRSKRMFYTGSIYSPWLSLEGRPNESSVEITFKRYQKKTSRFSIQMLEYALDDGSWTKAIDLGMEMGFDEKFELQKDKLTGHTRIRFRWTFNSSGFDEFLAIEDVLVKFKAEPTDQEMLRYVAGEHGFVQEVGKTDKLKLVVLKTPKGTAAPQVEAVPEDAENYEFAQWSDGKLDAKRSDAEFVTVQAIFKAKQKNTYTIAYIAQEGRGTIEGNPLQVVEENTSTTLVIARAQKGYRFAKWNDDKVEAQRSDIAKRTETYEAQFVQTCTLTYIAGEGGKIEGVAEQTVDVGSSGSEVKAVANAGYRFVQWSDGKTDNPRTDNNVTTDKTFTATFEELPKFTLTYNAGEGGTISGVTPQTVTQGQDGTEVEAVPNANYHFVKWDDGVMTAKRTDKNVTADKTVTAEFALNTYTLTYEPGDGGTITGQLLQTVAHGGDGTEVTAVPNAGYHFVKWDDEKTEATRKETNVTESKTYTAIFEADATTYTLTYIPGEGGTIRGETTQTVAAGGSGTEVEAVANTGYKFKKWDDGLTTAKRTDANVSADKTYTAEFEKITPVEDAALASVQVAPNPFSTLLRISSDELQNATYKLLNASGVVVRSGNFESHEVTIETSDLASGLYLLHITAENGATKVVRVVKE